LNVVIKEPRGSRTMRKLALVSLLFGLSVQ
jgi:hypothetical protein